MLIAFDYMQVDFVDLPRLPTTLPALMAMYAEDEADDESDDEQPPSSQPSQASQPQRASKQKALPAS